MGHPIIMKNIAALSLLLSGLVTPVLAHDTTDPHAHAPEPAAKPWPFKPETKGPVKAPEPLKDKVPVSGQGFWKFIAATNAVPLPDIGTNIVRAHGTVVFDADHDTVYFATKRVGWIAFSNQLRDSWIVQGDVRFKGNNVHGADIFPRKGKPALIAAADNEGYFTYLTDTTFQNPQILRRPEGGPYVGTNLMFRPTDTAFINAKQVFITDGYGGGYFMSATTDPFLYEPGLYGGHEFSKTPHGITFDPADKSLLVSARPEGQLKRWSVKKERVLEVGALPSGTLLCDVDLWGNYALAACLEAPNKAPGPLIIVNLKTQSIVSIIKPKEELGYAFADHMHDACWYVHKQGKKTDVYLVFTAWNPGGIGALKLVNTPD
jgi:hypothetical protein